MPLFLIDYAADIDYCFASSMISPSSPLISSFLPFSLIIFFFADLMLPRHDDAHFSSMMFRYQLVMRFADIDLLISLFSC